MTAPSDSIRPCRRDEIDAMLEIINGSARAYQGHIPADRYHEPYMPKTELEAEIANGVVFHGLERDGALLGVMGIQDKGPVVLIRHAYTRSESRGQGVGSALMSHLRELSAKPFLVGTWRAATWAIAFYEKHGFRLVSDGEKDKLLRRFWNIPERQVDTSVVLVDSRYS